MLKLGAKPVERGFGGMKERSVGFVWERLQNYAKTRKNDKETRRILSELRRFSRCQT